jgi:hypothetical protein
MPQAIVQGNEISDLLAKAKAIDSPHVNIAPLLGLGGPLMLGVDELHNAVLAAAGVGRELPAVSLRWGDGDAVTVEHVDGGAIAKLTIPF